MSLFIKNPQDSNNSSAKKKFIPSHTNSVKELIGTDEQFQNLLAKVITHHITDLNNQPESKIPTRLRTSQGVKHCLTSAVLAEKIFDICYTNKVKGLEEIGTKNFISLLTAFHNFSLSPSKIRDKNNSSNGKKFYNFAIKNGFDNESAILGGLIISCKDKEGSCFEESIKTFINNKIFVENKSIISRKFLVTEDLSKDYKEKLLKQNSGQLTKDELSQGYKEKLSTQYKQQLVQIVKEKLAWIKIINLAEDLSYMNTLLCTKESVKSYNNSGLSDELVKLKQGIKESNDSFFKTINNKSHLSAEEVEDREYQEILKTKISQFEKSIPLIGNNEMGEFKWKEVIETLVAELDIGNNQSNKIKDSVRDLVFQQNKLITRQESVYLKHHRKCELTKQKYNIFNELVTAFKSTTIQNDNCPNIAKIKLAQSILLVELNLVKQSEAKGIEASHQRKSFDFDQYSKKDENFLERVLNLHRAIKKYYDPKASVINHLALPVGNKTELHER